jgi:hypothetical protein
MPLQVLRGVHSAALAPMKMDHDRSTRRAAPTAVAAEVESKIRFNTLAQSRNFNVLFLSPVPFSHEIQPGAYCWLSP